MVGSAFSEVRDAGLESSTRNKARDKVYLVALVGWELLDTLVKASLPDPGKRIPYSCPAHLPRF